MGRIGIKVSDAELKKLLGVDGEVSSIVYQPECNNTIFFIDSPKLPVTKDCVTLYPIDNIPEAVEERFQNTFTDKEIQEEADILLRSEEFVRTAKMLKYLLGVKNGTF